MAIGPRSAHAVEDRLRGYKTLTLDALLSTIPQREPRRYLYDLIPLYPRRGGKGLRPGLCFATCGALGGHRDAALDSAVALELFHNAFLIHDDIEDESERRRGAPTLVAEYGPGIAVNVGDAMNVLSMEPLMRNLPLLGPNVAWAILEEVHHMVRQSVEGQAMELGWVRDNVVDITEDDYLRMTLKKTCWYTCIHPCRIGAIIAQGDSRELDRFNRFGYFMGAAFQIQDDVLNLAARQERYGKEINGDIWEGKRTLMLIHLAGTCSPSERRRLHVFLSHPRKMRREADVRWVRKLMDHYGSIEHAVSRARDLAHGALHEFEQAYADAPDSADRRFIRQIVSYMIERDL